jgi:outer membrane protein, multidrug efflux system
VNSAGVITKPWIALCGASFLGGCAVGPDYHRPSVSAPAAFRFDPSPGTAHLSEWAGVYRDEKLSALVREALADGFDVQIAAARVEEARAAAIEARAGLLPAISSDGTVGRGKNDTFNSAYPNSGLIANSGAATLGALWEFDLWGRVRRDNEAARARWLASVEGRRGVELGLMSDIAVAYFELVEMDEELAISEQAASSFAESRRIFSQRVEGGTASALEAARAQADWDDATAEIPADRQAIAQLENRLSILLGRQPGPIARANLGSSMERFPSIPAGLPSDLLERRPDILQAEDELRAANADVGEAMGEFFPKIGLTAVFGQISPDLKGFTRSASRVWGVGADADAPLFEGGRLVGNFKGAKAVRTEAEKRYAQTVLVAFREVSDALVARERLAERQASEVDEVSALEGAAQLSRSRYVAGKADYFEVLEAQQQLFPAQRALAQTQRDQLLASVALYRALGGGWSGDRAHP